MELSQEKLEEMVVGKPIDPTIEFYEQAVLDPEESKRQGRRVYIEKVMIKRTIPGVNDYVAQRATAKDIKHWPREYQAFKMNVQSKKSPGLEVLYGISNIEKQELIDRGFSTVERLATAMDVPEHLAHLQPKAQRIHEAIKAEEVRNAEEKSEQETRREETPEVPAARGQEHHPDVRQPTLQAVRPEGSEQPSQRHEENRRFNDPTGIDPIDNWTVEF